MTHARDSTPEDVTAQKVSGCRPRAISVLYVEPSVPARAAAAELLEEFGFEVLAVGTGAEARCARRNPGTVDVFVTELRLPDADARDLVRELRSAWPDLRVIFVSVYAANEPEVAAALGEPGCTYLEKGLDIEELARVICALAGGSPSAASVQSA